MILRNKWERYIFKEFIKVFLFFLFAFYILYILIDYSINAQSLQSPDLGFLDIVMYYINTFIVQAEILLPITIAVATTRVLYQFNISNQIVAFLVSGIRKIYLLRPILYAALLCTLFLFISYQYIYPKAIHTTSEAEDQIFKNPLSAPIKIVNLPNGTKIVYQSYDRTEGAFKDVYWIYSINHIDHIKELYPFREIPFGLHVDTLKRSSQGFLELASTEKKVIYDGKLLSPKILKMQISDLQMLPLSKLVSQARFYKTPGSDRRVKTLAILYSKLLIPFASIIAVLIPSSMCLQFSRRIPIFFIYSITFFSVLLFFTLMDTAQVLAESQVFPVIPCIVGPPLLYFAFFGWRFSKIN